MSKNTGKLSIKEAINSDEIVDMYAIIHDEIKVSDGSDYDEIMDVINNLSDEVRGDVIMGLIIAVNQCSKPTYEGVEM